jgi:hypothetical protein
MKRIIHISIVLTILFLCNPAFAQLKPWSKLFLFDGAYAMVTSDETSHSLDGYSFGIGFEQLNLSGHMSAGVSLMYLNSQDKNDEREVDINFSSVPISVYLKYLFGKGSVSGFIQGGLGVQFSDVEYTGQAVYLSGGDSGMAFSAGAGGHIFVNEKMFINVAYNFMYMGNSYYQDGLVHLFKLGLGFQYN